MLDFNDDNLQGFHLNKDDRLGMSSTVTDSAQDSQVYIYLHDQVGWLHSIL